MQVMEIFTSWWLNHPSEQYARQIWSFPQPGMRINTCWKPPPSYSISWLVRDVSHFLNFHSTWFFCYSKSWPGLKEWEFKHQSGAKYYNLLIQFKIMFGKFSLLNHILLQWRWLSLFSLRFSKNAIPASHFLHILPFSEPHLASLKYRCLSMRNKKRTPWSHLPKLVVSFFV